MFLVKLGLNFQPKALLYILVKQMYLGFKRFCFKKHQKSNKVLRIP